MLMMNAALLRSIPETHSAFRGKSRRFGLRAALRELRSLSTWENEGGSLPSDPGFAFTQPPLVGSEGQIEWAESIRVRVNEEFDRVAGTLRAVARRQAAESRSKTEAIIAILEDKRAEVLARQESGYFIHDWQEISDQVRQMIGADPRYAAIRAEKAAHGSVNRGTA
jgi:hypothetical protein